MFAENAVPSFNLYFRKSSYPKELYKKKKNNPQLSQNFKEFNNFLSNVCY